MISTETKARIADELLSIQAAIDFLEANCPHDQLPPEYDALILRRDAGRELLQ